MKNTLSLSILALSAVVSAAGTRPLVIAHRGASGYLPEHTLPAKALAYGLGADFLEQDIVLTKDDVPVILHDIHLDTVTDVAQRFPARARADGRYYVLDLTLAELKQLRVTERFNPKTGLPVFPKRFPAGKSEFHLSTLEEELQLIQGLNHSMGRDVGIYPEIKQPQWHRDEGHDISAIVLPILRRYGYATKSDACFLQCFELPELKRIRTELAWQGRIVLLIDAKAVSAEGLDQNELCTAAGLKELAGTVDGLGPPISRVVTWSADTGHHVSDLVQHAHAAGLLVHAYTIRVDELPKNCPSTAALHAALFKDAGIDGAFSDFPDATLTWLAQNPAP